jgi:NADH-quinone oxidoreductase subunit E
MDIKNLDSILEDRDGRPDQLIEALQDIQALYNYLPEEALRTVSERLAVPIIEVFRVAHFYKAFSLEQRGRHLITICTGTACHVRGAPKFVDEVAGQLNITPGQTTEDKMFTVETVNCVGACALGPVLIMDGTYHDHMNPLKLRKLVRSAKENDKETAINE